MTLTLEDPSAKTSPKTVRLTAAQALVRFMEAQSSEQLDGSICPLFGGVFGIFGHGNVAGVGEALSHADLSYYRGQNEQGMAHIAIAFAKASRRRRAMGVTTSIGPGATNLVTACALAHVNRLPVMFLPGDIFASRRPDPVLQQLEDERNPLKSVNACFEPISRYFDIISRPQQLIASLPRAVEVMLDPVTCGPVTLCLPQDVQTEAYDFPLWLFEQVTHQLRRQAPDQLELERAAKLLSQANKPLIVAGGGVHYSGACDALQAFAESHGVPVAETQAGKGTLHHAHSLSLGGVGVTGTSAANAIAREADVVLCVGTRLSDFTTASKSLFMNPEVNFIGLNVNSPDSRKLRASPLVGDAKRGLNDLSERVVGWRTSAEYLVHVGRLKDEWEGFRKLVTEPDSVVPTDAQVVAAVNEIAGEEGTVVCAAGGLPGELHKLWNPESTKGYHLEYGYSCMGYEIAGGVGVKMAEPAREVYVLVGDGSYLMLHTELLTARSLGLKINVIVTDNHGFGCINRLQQGCGSAPFGNLLKSVDGSVPYVDFAANARSYGCHGVKVDSVNDLKETLAANRKRDDICVTVIETDPKVSTEGTAWWDVAVSETSNVESVKLAHGDYRKQLDRLGYER